MASIAQSYMLRDQIEATYEWADKAASLAESLDLIDVRLTAMVDKGTAMLNARDRVEEGRRLLKTAADEAERIDDHVLAARALNNLVWDARQWSDAAEVREMIERAHRHAEAAGFELVAAIDLAANQAHLEAVDGDLDAAIAQLDNARYTSAGNAVSWTDGPWLAVMRAGLALEAGDLETAQRFTDMAKPPTERAAVGVFGLDFHLACRRGDLPAARDRLRAFGDMVAHDGVAYPGQTHDLLAAALRAGLTTTEMRPLVDQVGLYVGHRLPPDDPWRQLIDAQVAEAEGRLDTAADLYAAAAEGLASAPEVLAAHIGTAHVGTARTLVAQGRLDEARARAEAAAPFLARWRGWRVDELRAIERRLGLGPEPSGPEALTPREREVASLLAEGLTNSQVAERLYISPRTAAVHVSNILAKLGMSSRTEVATWAVRESLEGS
jgi:DNA-binding CsgD family transcriptional regulator